MFKNTDNLEAAVHFRWDAEDMHSDEGGSCKMIFCIARIDNHNALAGQFSLGSELTSAQLILHLYQALGTDCANHLLGDFAFAISDSRKRHIYAARDFMGCQPVYYRRDGQGMMIADTIEQLIELSGEYPALDESYIAASLTRVFTHHEKTYFTDFKKIPPAHYLIASQNSCETYRYWQAEDIEERRWSSHEECLDEFRGLLKQAISDRLPSTGRTGVLRNGS